MVSRVCSRGDTSISHLQQNEEFKALSRRGESLDSEQWRQHSHLFTVRLWHEELGNGQMEWRGKVQDVTSGEARYFREWSKLLAFLIELLAKSESLLDRHFRSD